MSMNSQALSGGFAQPVYDTQAVFRQLMDGMARPGTIQTVSVDLAQPAPFGRAAGAVALTLCDSDTPVWLPSAILKSPVAAWIAFHTGAQMTEEKAQAKFAFVSASAPACSLGLFSAGTQEYPDRSTTLVIEVEAIGSGEAITLCGPGIKDRLTISVAGMPDVFVSFWAENRALFPRGVDVILTAGDRFVCLPRTTRFV